MPSRFRRAPVSTDKRLRKTRGGGDHGTSERWQHSGRVLELTDRAGIVAARVAEEHILDTLALHEVLEAHQVKAGLRFKEDYHLAAIESRVTGSYSGMSSMRDFFHAVRDRSDSEDAAYRRWRKAISWLAPRQSAIVIATVCHDKSLAPRDIDALRTGLTELAKKYGFAKERK